MSSGNRRTKLGARRNNFARFIDNQSAHVKPTIVESIHRRSS